MGFGKKSEKSEKREKDGDLDTKKASLFNKFKAPKPSTPVPAASNPYAAAPQSNRNPYATQPVVNDPYAPKSQSSLTQPPASSFGSLTLNSERGSAPAYGRVSPAPSRGEKSAVPAGGYGGAAPRYQSQGSYGQAGGYGGDPYGNGNGQGQSRHGAEGYGGMGRRSSHDTVSTDVGRSALFGDAPQRAQQQQPPAAAAQPGGDSSYSNTGGYDSAEMPGGYGAGPERELTAEEQENLEVEDTKTEIRRLKGQGVASSSNALRVAEQAQQTGLETLARLGVQGERIHNTRKNLDMASINNRHAEDKARELRTLNRSMWAVHVDNPFTSSSRHEAKIMNEQDKHRAERAQKERTREQAFGSQARQQAQQRDIHGNVVRQTNTKSLADRGKFQFDADSEDDEMENQIDDNLYVPALTSLSSSPVLRAQIHHAVTILKKVGNAMSEELDSQVKDIGDITVQADTVDDEIRRNRTRLDIISKRG
ncbi:hypothetical protein LTR08_005320 [Meristemomyces frigidus]|nr:hypothetical protein LTR08_005320 [Meristemomyces frigidus]